MAIVSAISPGARCIKKKFRIRTMNNRTTPNPTRFNVIDRYCTENIGKEL
jgi:hypothetical protein